MITEKEIAPLRDQFIRLINLINQLEKTPRTYGTNTKLYASEITAIEMIGDYPGINITEFAKRQGITKGAVSQLIKKLEKKELVQRYQDRMNSKEVKLKLANKGAIAWHQHKTFHLKFDHDFFNQMTQMTSEQLAFLTSFFATLENLFRKGLETL